MKNIGIIARLIVLTAILTLFAVNCKDKSKNSGDDDYYDYPPVKPFDPSPASSSSNVSIYATLRWSTSWDTNGCRVFFGKPYPLKYAGEYYFNSFKPEKMSYSTHYYWRVVAFNESGETYGPIWHFSTEHAPQIKGKWSPISFVNAPLGGGCVWTGSDLIAWMPDCGGIYHPENDSWTAISTINQPNIHNCAAVWTGSRMMVFGEENASGGFYDPENDSWTLISAENAPGVYDDYSYAWTGNGLWISSKPFVTPPSDIMDYYYNLDNDSWSVLLPPYGYSGAGHSVVWTGDKLIFWGGVYYYPVPTWGFPWEFGSIDEGIVYDTASGEKTYITIKNAPFPRNSHSTIWTGSEMIVWGGMYCYHEAGDVIPPEGLRNELYHLNDGGFYYPENNSWVKISTNRAPSPRAGNFMCWTGDTILVLGPDNTGGIYDPAIETWTATETENAPLYINPKNAVWTGEKVIVFGGTPETSGIFDPNQ